MKLESEKVVEYNETSSFSFQIWIKRGSDEIWLVYGPQTEAVDTATVGIENAHPLHIGGGNTFPFGYAKMTPALHGGKIDAEGGEAFTTVPGGFLVNFNDGKRFHHAGDTALITDMQLLAGKVDIALLPIGDNFTMGIDDAVDRVRAAVPEAPL